MENDEIYSTDPVKQKRVEDLREEMISKMSEASSLDYKEYIDAVDVIITDIFKRIEEVLGVEESLAYFGSLAPEAGSFKKLCDAKSEE